MRISSFKTFFPHLTGYNLAFSDELMSRLCPQFNFSELVKYNAAFVQNRKNAKNENSGCITRLVWIAVLYGIMCFEYKLQDNLFANYNDQHNLTNLRPT